ncbi:outer envelope protein [Aquirhabdus sp.]|uniref:outer envelope protein n=1 Tax=Aquirhabdus sp. TaxID=2824160 RepID=UPI00396CD3CA
MLIQSMLLLMKRGPMLGTLIGGVATAVLCSSTAQAAEWSDTSLGWRYGTMFAEPYDNKPDGSRQDISKNIISLTHSSGYAYGTNFFNVDLLLSDSKDPGKGTTDGAQEAYVVYRNTVDFGKVFKKDLSIGPARSFGMEGGFDFNSKNDSYSSKKRLFVVGPTMMMDVPGYLNISVLALFESNNPDGIAKRYEYKAHPELEVVWGLPVFSLPLSFEGYGLFIASKGKNEFGQSTAPETHLDMQLMYDLSPDLGIAKKTLRVGAEYEYWHNKFGNPESQAGKGATASTPMVRVEYHF